MKSIRPDNTLDLICPLTWCGQMGSCDNPDLETKRKELFSRKLFMKGKGGRKKAFKLIASPNHRTCLWDSRHLFGISGYAWRSAICYVGEPVSCQLEIDLQECHFFMLLCLQVKTIAAERIHREQVATVTAAFEIDKRIFWSASWSLNRRIDRPMWTLVGHVGVQPRQCYGRLTDIVLSRVLSAFRVLETPVLHIALKDYPVCSNQCHVQPWLYQLHILHF